MTDDLCQSDKYGWVFEIPKNTRVLTHELATFVSETRFVCNMFPVRISSMQFSKAFGLYWLKPSRNVFDIAYSMSLLS